MHRKPRVGCGNLFELFLLLLLGSSVCFFVDLRVIRLGYKDLVTAHVFVVACFLFPRVITVYRFATEECPPFTDSHFYDYENGSIREYHPHHPCQTIMA